MNRNKLSSTDFAIEMYCYCCNCNVMRTYPYNMELLLAITTNKLITKCMTITFVLTFQNPQSFNTGIHCLYSCYKSQQKYNYISFLFLSKIYLTNQLNYIHQRSVNSRHYPTSLGSTLTLDNTSNSFSFYHNLSSISQLYT